MVVLVLLGWLAYQDALALKARRERTVSAAATLDLDRREMKDRLGYQEHGDSQEGMEYQVALDVLERRVLLEEMVVSAILGGMVSLAGRVSKERKESMV